MNVSVEVGRFLSVTCDPDERIVFDRREDKYHLLRQSAARLWDEIGEGGTFDVEAVGDEPEGDPIAQLRDAGIIEIAASPGADGRGDRISRRSWMSRTGKVTAAAIVLPLVATISSPSLILGQDEESGGPVGACSLVNAESSGGFDSSGDGESEGDDSGDVCENGESESG
jgi:hypothetical protein